MKQRATLGFHYPGDHHYYAIFGEGNVFFGGTADDKFLTHEAFSGLVTAVHEHYHLMQELLQGFSWWRQDVLDRFGYASMMTARKGTKQVSIPLFEKPNEAATQVVIDYAELVSLLPKFWLELKNIDRYTSRPHLTRSLLQTEIRQSPELAAFLSEEAYELTALDLMECHAAILTELYLSKLIADHPEKFNQQVVSDLAGLFRVDQMLGGYQRPLRVFLKICEAANFRMQLPPGGHDLFYGQITYGSCYFLLAFLLDYALHLPPEPLHLLSAARDAASQQDIHPPFRFINLAFLWVLETIRNEAGIAKILTSERLYYSSAADYLAEQVNRMHAMVRLPGAPRTFFKIGEITEMWTDTICKSPMANLFPLFGNLRRACWNLRKDSPDFWFDLDPLQFDTSVELPRVVVTAKGMATYPYMVDRDNSLQTESMEEQMELLKRYATPHYQTLYGTPGTPWQKADDVPATMHPFRFIEETVIRQLFYRFSVALVYEGEMRCSLTEGLGAFMPCSPRTPACERISQFGSLPAEGCLLRENGNRWSGDIDRFKREEVGWVRSLFRKR